ncbi:MULTISPECIES: GntR family transcriptional regulator [unclassified Cryobacterium]|uniref:GntR family transcriptional regulator n=1 Tax=unclassified Cryobacterium TaxID=2649013 RepID=UPI001D0BF3C7|nr:MULTISPECIES: GntR family transcriptional regulator [unclassified Cryobacterium]
MMEAAWDASRVVVDPQSSVPPFEQLRTHLLEQVSSGTLAPGTRLPTVRRLADDLGIAPGTVARAYRELELDQIIETRGRNGTFVSTHGDAAERKAQEAAAEYAARIRQLGIDAEEGVRLVAAALGSAPSS